MTERKDIINYLIRRYNLKSYLEIGLSNPALNFYHINADFKESCDPYIQEEFKEGCSPFKDGKLTREISDFLTYRMTSDELFAMTPYDKKWDIIFIDGLHLKEQVTKDILNAMKHLNENGFIVVHDCLPICEEVQNRERTTEKWNGDVWKAVARLGELGMIFTTFDTDEGVAIIPYQKFNNILREKCFDTEHLTWEYYEKNYDSLMHVAPESDINDLIQHS